MSIARQIHLCAFMAFAWALSGLTGHAANAQSAEPYFQGKTINIIVYSDAGSSYDIYARVLAKHLPNHIPGKPSVIVKDMVGAGGLTATRYLYNVAPRDGTTIGTLSRGIPFEPLFGNTTVEFDPLKFVWLGSMSKETTIYISWHTSKIKLISGYKGASDAALRLEQEEIEGIYWTWNGINTTHPDWITEKKLNLLFQTRATPHPELPDVPLVTVLAKTDFQRQELALMFSRDVLGRPFNAPPEIGAERTKILRDAFNASIKDPALLADADKGKMEIELVTGEEVEKIIRDAYAAPTDVVEGVKKAMGR